jgi:hypothetical protein
MCTIFWLENLKEETTRRPRTRWENCISMDLREIGKGGVNWIHLTQDRKHLWHFVKAVKNFQVPLKAENLLTSRVAISFSGRALLHCVSLIR